MVLAKKTCLSESQALRAIRTMCDLHTLSIIDSFTGEGRTTKVDVPWGDHTTGVPYHGETIVGCHTMGCRRKVERAILREPFPKDFYDSTLNSGLQLGR